MIAKIAPLRRMPSKLDLFDYKTSNINKNIKPGQLVKIPFRGSEIFGIIFELQSESVIGSKLKHVKSVVHSTPFFSKPRLNFFKDISEIYNISCATQAKISFLPLQKKKLQELNLKPLSKIKNPENDSIKFQLYRSEQEHKSIYKDVDSPALILVPQLKFIEEIRSLLNRKENGQITTWHSDLSQKEQFKRWLQVRNKEVEYIIGNRSAVFLPFQNLKEIIIDYEQKDNHKHWDQSPRYHSLDIAEKLQKIYGCKLKLTTFSPSCRSYFNIYKNNYKSEEKTKEKIKNLSKNKPKLINMKEERKAGNYGIFSEQVKTKIKNTPNNTFIFINRLGYSRSINCKQCDYIAECERCNLPYVYHKEENKIKCHYCNTEMPIPTTCPNCKNQVVEYKGVGAELVEEKINEITENKKITRIDSKQEDIKDNSNNIIIGTKKALKYIDWEQTELILFVNIDSQLRFPEFKTSENVWQLIQEIQFYKKEKSEFYIQTINPDQLVLKSLSQPDRFYRMDLNSRKNLNYPPYKYLTRLFYGHKSKEKVLQESQNLYSKLSEKLTQNYKTNIIISEPNEMHPKFYRNKYWQMMLIKFPSNNWSQELKWLNSFIDSEWKVDPRPISILSP